MLAGDEVGRVARRSIRRSVALGLFAAVVAAVPAGANTNVTISDAATTNAVFGGGTYTMTGATANINTGELNANLGVGSVTVQATNGLAGAGTITVSGPSPVSWGNNALNLLTSTAAGDIAINAPVIGNGGGSPALTMSTGGSITQTAPLQSGNQVTLSAGEAITLTDANNDFTLVSANTGPFNIQLNDINSVALLPVGTAGNLALTAGGSITQSGGSNAVVGGTTTLNSSAAPITMGSAGNNFTGAVSLTNTGANDALVTDSDAIGLGASTIGRNLTVNAGGSITQSGALTTGGTFSASAGANPITLSNASNNFTGNVSLTNTGANDAQVTDSNALGLGASTIGRNLTVNANGSITQSGAVTTGGTFSATAGANPITLNNASNNFIGAVSLTNTGANDAQVTDTNTIGLGASTIGRNLTVNAGGPITQSGAVTTGGTFTATAGANPITLNNASNDFTGNVIVSGAGNTTLADANALSLGTSQITGSTTLTAPTSITAGSFTNDFQGAVSATTNGALTLRDDTDLALGAISSNGGDIFADNALTQTGAITDAGLFEAQGDSVTLTNAANNFTQAGFQADAGAIDARDANSVSILGVDATGAAKLTAGTGIKVLPANAAFTAASLTLVTDDAAGASVGPGGIEIPATRSLVSTGAPLRIYTAKQSQNTIAAGALLNGAGFTPGPEFVNSATEVWNTLFPAGTATNPFTIFYKDRETTPPETTIDSGPAAGSTIADPTPTFTFSSNEAGSTFECAVDSAAFSACTSPNTLATLSDGTHNFAVRATDASGNTDPSPAQRNFTVETTPPDTAPPDTQITKKPKKKIKTKKKKVSVSFEFRSTEAGSSLECRIDGGAFAACTSPKKFKAKKGTHQFAVRATDAAGNTDGSPARFDFKVKRKKPKH